MLKTLPLWNYQLFFSFFVVNIYIIEPVQKGGQKEQRSSRKQSLELPARMFCIREERKDELTKKFEAIFAGLFEHPLIAKLFPC
ncbi:hypothetical protein ACOI1C_07885 [Bacillus sp. DJP31]|uniref:hypothetical protein n=1 Tax=Bacillus sp. DJP31 TaxID=3409789 RepID=UPI003BB695E6